MSRLEWLDEAVETKAMAFVYNAREEVISGTLRNNRGTVRIFKNYDKYTYYIMINCKI